MKHIKLKDCFYVVAIIILTSLYLKDHFFSDNKSFKELTAERINVVGPDGNLYIVLSNPERQQCVLQNGKLLDTSCKSRPVPGLMFFDQKGSERGGLIFNDNEDGKYHMLTFDQFDNDMVMFFRLHEYTDEGKKYKAYGLNFMERSDESLKQIVDDYTKAERLKDSSVRKKELKRLNTMYANSASDRMYIGRTYEGFYGLIVCDKKGAPVMELGASEEGKPVFNLIDSVGNKNTMLNITNFQSKKN